MRRRRQALTALAAALTVATLAAAAVNASGTDPAPVAAGEGPPGLTTQYNRMLPVPGEGGSGFAPRGESPDGAADAAFEARAFPLDTIPEPVAREAATSFSDSERRRLGPGEDNRNGWQVYGPRDALYPYDPLRTTDLYLPNSYVASGRVTALAISDSCRPRRCVLYVAAAGGGIWRTDDALASTPRWRYLAGPLGINAVGTVTIDPNDRGGDTVYVGTGEANTCGSGCVAGVGIYRSTNGGRTWEGPLGQAPLGAKGIGEIAVQPGDPNVLYAATTTALRGMSSVCCAGITRPVPGAAQWGLYKSADRGATWALVHNGAPTAAECRGDAAEFANQGTCSPRGVREVKIDPADPRVLYAGSYARGVWRSPDAGATWTQIKPSLNPAVLQTRPAIALNRLANGATRMYVYEGNIGNPYARLFRSDDVRAAAPQFTDLTSANPADPGFGTYNLCGGQCWYDVFVHSPAGHPDVVYAGGSYQYGESIGNHRAVMLSRDAGVSSTDMTYDATSPNRPNGLHPDQHDLVTIPGRPLQFIEANDGGVMRSSGTLADASATCDGRGLVEPALARCRQLLSAVPGRLTSLNRGLASLQFLSLSVSPHDPDLLQGGTQDNGTWENKGRRDLWVNTMIGDGGQSGFDVANPAFRFHTFFDANLEVNFAEGKLSDWIVTSDPIAGLPGTQFYVPAISDPAVSGTLFVGTGRTVHRTTTHGLGDRSLEEAQRICNTWTGTFEAPCGDWQELGTQPLTDAVWGDRAGGAVAAVERVASDRSTAWAATTTGRVFVSRNVDAQPASAVTWTRVDSPTTPNRFVSSIHVDPADPGRAWVSYNGFDANTPTTPGHVFDVAVDAAGLSTWTDLSLDLGDQPVTDLVRDDLTGDLYAATDFGVLRLSPEPDKQTWVLAAPGMPNVEVPGLTIVPGARILYAASHGLGAWRLQLDPDDPDEQDGQGRRPPR